MHRVKPLLFAPVALSGAALLGAPSAEANQIVLNPSLAETWERFSGGQFFLDNSNDRIRTVVFDSVSGRQPSMQFTGLNAALTNAGFTKADIIGAKLEMTVKDFDTENGLFAWTLYSVNDGVTNEDFNLTVSGGVPDPIFDDLPAMLDGADIRSSVDTTQAVAQDTIQLALGVDPRPQDGDVQTFDIPDLGFLTGDTNDTLTFHLHQTTGADSQFRAQWHANNVAANLKPRLVVDLVPEPGSLALLGLGGLALLGRRRRSA